VPFFRQRPSSARERCGNLKILREAKSRLTQWPRFVSRMNLLVASLIERCPKTMMIRELMMNALEAAKQAPQGKRLVEISSQEIDGASKLTIWNTGPGMDAIELLQICDIASSIGKEKSITGNFGMGAKVASLPSNTAGMRYRSCKHGRVHEVILGKRDGVYGRLRRRVQESDEYLEVYEVTELAIAGGRSTDHEWTEVVLLGNKEQQTL
jgi:anti-sigma regulatory factor (Ser/Thr protein kinase)